ncbi:MAG TPA: hypothetical protein PK379_13665 [Candidatus Hydrogenedentes bacterium]|nr:hypothetical protein [Candidatus Hydrogenedentota bacterium]HOJ68121.1 hypothetical protein [Candidatus Hydrogenedentota bacterium]HOK91066.1 hypothetical protein [Candidatus Hydrogenedentota bacterium]
MRTKSSRKNVDIFQTVIPRICVLGGSSVYVPELVNAIIARNLPVEEIVLFGHPGRKLETVAGFCKRLVNRAGYPTLIIPETDIRAAVRGAKYIVNQMRVGGMKARFRDESLPPQFDLLGSEQVGAGAVTNALRSLPILLEYARVIEELAPEAVVINMMNPVGIVVEALSRLTRLRVIGVCDLARKYRGRVATLLGLPQAEVEVDYFGAYHFGWIQDVRYEGRSRMAQLVEAVEGSGDPEFDRELVSLFRMIPTREAAAYFRRGDILRDQKRSHRYRSELLIEAESQILRIYEDPRVDMIPEVTRQRNAIWYEESVLPLLESFEGHREVKPVLCVPNQGAILDLPEDACVEVPTTIREGAVTPRRVGALPRFLRGLFCMLKESDRLVIDAARHASFELALQALAINPFVDSLASARKYLEKVVRAENLNLA